MNKETARLRAVFCLFHNIVRLITKKKPKKRTSTTILARFTTKMVDERNKNLDLLFIT